jgi:hypothetical protein
MANKRIKDLAAVTSPTSGDIIAVDGATTRGIAVENYRDWVLQTPSADQHITSSGPAAVNANAGVVRVDQTSGAPIVLTVPLASAKTCDVLIADWKCDAGTNNITINLSGTDKFPGGLTSWTIAADGGSVFLRRIPGVGYAV